jgi:hypothetical protein
VLLHSYWHSRSLLHSRSLFLSYWHSSSLFLSIVSLFSSRKHPIFHSLNALTNFSLFSLLGGALG